MSEITRRAEFYAGNRGPKTFHIETDGCIVNITVGLRTDDGREVTRVDVLPEDETRGGDAEGRCWRQAIGDARVIRDPDPQLSLLEEPWCNHDAVAVVDGVCECGHRVAD